MSSQTHGNRPKIDLEPIGVIRRRTAARMRLRASDRAWRLLRDLSHMSAIRDGHQTGWGSRVDHLEVL
jgi:hypothetical protein